MPALPLRKGIAIDFVEGASVLIAMAANIENACKQVRGDFVPVRLRKSDLIHISRALRQSAIIIDNLTMALERGERFAPVEPQDPKPPSRKFNESGSPLSP